MPNAYKELKAALDEVRAEMEEVSQLILEAAEERHPGIGDRWTLLTKKESLLQGAAVKAWVDNDPNAPYATDPSLS